MPIQIIRAANVASIPFTVDAIVVTSTNTESDKAIYQAAGEELLVARKEIIGTIEDGEVKATDSFKLRDKAQKIFHVVVPIFNGGYSREINTLHNCYKKCFSLALREKFSSIALPILGVENNFSINEAVRIAIAESIRFAVNYDNFNIILVTFDKDFRKCKKIFPKGFIKQYITNSEVENIKKHHVNGSTNPEEFRKNQVTTTVQSKNLEENFLTKLSEFMQKNGLNLEDEKDLKHLVRLGHISDRVRQSIREARKNEKNYNPSKLTAIRFGVALALSLEDLEELINSAGYILYHGNDLDRRIKNYVYHSQNAPDRYSITIMEREIPDLLE